MFRQCAAVAVLLVLLAACAAPPPTSSATSTPQDSATSTPQDWPAAITPSVLGAPKCQPPSQLVTISSGGLRPLLGTPRFSTTRAVLALFLRPTVGVEQKMVLRMSGTGPVTIFAHDGDGLRTEVIRVDAGHGSSSYDPIFPGTNEWGALFTFGKAGCWRIEVLRADAAADFYVEVSAS